jgi:hypothetical protein
VSILTEANRVPEPDTLYGVWASEIPGQSLTLHQTKSGFALSGCKMFCTGAGLIDRALITVCSPDRLLVDVDLRANLDRIIFDSSSWIPSAFAGTCTSTASFTQATVAPVEVIGATGWYLERPGFWHGACGPAACWAGGAIGLVDYAMTLSRNDPHTLAHLGAMVASAWGLWSYLDTAGNEIDEHPFDIGAARTRALIVRHLIEQACSDILRRFARAYGPRPLAFEIETSRRYQELDLYIRQSHAERDLETLGNDKQREVRDR